MSDPRPIGVFDSGVGGLTVLRELRGTLPAEGLVYVADLEQFPYGPRPLAEVRERALSLVERLAAMDTKLVVIACNTATAAALNAARERFDIPIVGVIAPGAQAAAAATRNGRVAVLSTQATLQSGEYVHAIREANPGVLVHARAAPELVTIVEDGDADSVRAESALLPHVRAAAEWGADTLVLGCTHYPLLEPALRRVNTTHLTIVDSARTTAARVARILEVNRLTAAPGDGEVRTLVTAMAERFARAAARLFAEPLPPPQIFDAEPAAPLRVVS